MFYSRISSVYLPLISTKLVSNNAYITQITAIANVLYGERDGEGVENLLRKESIRSYPNNIMS